MIKHIPNFITSLNLFAGAVGCISVLDGNLESAFYFVVICGIFDFLDGLMARLLKVKSAIGKELDSLADLISFGLLPGLFIYSQLKGVSGHPYLPYFGLLVVVFSALRLAKFNLDETQAIQFKGLPTPANAIMLTSLPFMPASLSFSWEIWLGTAMASCFLLVSPFTLIALKFRGFSWEGNRLKYIFLLAIIVLLITFRAAALPWVIPIYLFVSIVGNSVMPEHVK